MKSNRLADPFPTLDKIIALGTLLSKCAEYFRDNEILARDFLADCAEQCQHTAMKEMWGEELASEIMLFDDPLRDKGHIYKEQEIALLKDSKG